MMEHLNKMFNGDWLLTVAAYNSGEGRVVQAVKANRAKGKPTDFWALSLPRETSIYVPKMLALSELIKNSKKYGINLPETNQDRALARVDVGQQIQLTQAAQMAGMSLTKLKSFNSGYKRNVTAPVGHGPHYIMLPKTHAEQLKDSLVNTDIAAIQPTRLAQNSTKSASGSQYKVRPGDTLSAIAKRLNIKTRDLQSWNNLRTKSTLQVGQTLQLASNTTSSSITYQVRKGDSVASIARRHGVNTDDVMRWNSVVSKANSLQPGLKLTLFVNDKSTPGT
jgi:membrane-bound lytic murein transglycosylase D